MSNLLPEGEWELEQEDESLARLGARFTVRLNLGNQGFRTSTPFLDDWIKRSAAGQIGTTVNFRRRFCAANHFEVDVPIKGRTRTLHVAEIWGLPMVYFSGNGSKPLLSRIMPRGWHLSQVGRWAAAVLQTEAVSRNASTGWRGAAAVTRPWSVAGPSAHGGGRRRRAVPPSRLGC